MEDIKQNQRVMWNHAEINPELPMALKNSSDIARDICTFFAACKRFNLYIPLFVS
jgi:hypothetical protein